jgi:hypothetical protein
MRGGGLFHVMDGIKRGSTGWRQITDFWTSPYDFRPTENNGPEMSVLSTPKFINISIRR